MTGVGGRVIKKLFDDWLTCLVTFSLIPLIVSAIMSIETESLVYCELSISSKYLDEDKFELGLGLLVGQEFVFAMTTIVLFGKHSHPSNYYFHAFSIFYLLLTHRFIEFQLWIIS